MKLICGSFLISELVAAHLVATNSFALEDIEIVNMPAFRNRVLDLHKNGIKACVICSNSDIIESEYITYVDSITYFDKIELPEQMAFAVKCAIRDLSSNEYDSYISAFSNYILHDISTISSFAYTNSMEYKVYSASDVSQQSGIWNDMSVQMAEKCKIVRPSKNFAIVTGSGYVRYIARRMLLEDKILKCVAFVINNSKVYIYFRDGINPQDYIAAHAWYEGYCEYCQFAAALTKSAVYNLITCIAERLALDFE